MSSFRAWVVRQLNRSCHPCGSVSMLSGYVARFDKRVDRPPSLPAVDFQLAVLVVAAVLSFVPFAILLCNL
jgi:hypothetical protein